MKLAFLGTGDFAVAALRALAASGHLITRAISQPDRPAGRGLDLRPTPVRIAAEALSIPHLQADDVNRDPPEQWLAGADLGVVAAFGQKLGRGLLAAAPRGFINIHASLLPRYRGAAPYQWAILNGDATTGVTVFQLNERWDAGAIWARRETPIGDTETADELHDRLAELGAELVLETVARMEQGAATPLAQDDAAATRAPKLTKADGRLDWDLPARKLTRRIHGLWSWPAATARFQAADGREELLQLVRATVEDELCQPSAALPPGALTTAGAVQAGRGTIRLLEIKPAGKRIMSFAAFANARKIQPPARFIPDEPHE